MARLSIRMMCMTLGFLLAASAVHAADSCLAPCAKIPKKTRHVSTAPSIILPAGSAVLLTTPGATLAKGKKKRVIVVEATMTSGIPGPLPMVLTMSATLNGVAMEPTGNPVGIITECGGTGLSPWLGGPFFGCTLSGTFWLDLDQAETASPGTFIGMPLTVALLGGDFAGVGGPPVVVSMAVREESK